MLTHEALTSWAEQHFPLHLFPFNSLSVGDDDDQYGRDAADDDDDCQSQERPLCVAHSLRGFLHAGHHVGGSDLQNPSTGREKGLELLIDVQEFTVQKPLGGQTWQIYGTESLRLLRQNLY